MKPKIDLIKYIGHPYESYDCLKLVQEFYKDHYDVTVKNYFEGDVPDRREVNSLIVSNKGDFARVDKPQFGDIVVISLYGLECHIGVCTSKGLFLHSVRGAGSLQDKLSRYEKMITGFYRLRDANDPT